MSKWTEKDFVLERVDSDSGSVTSINVNHGVNDARFDFLNEYKSTTTTNTNPPTNTITQPTINQPSSFTTNPSSLPNTSLPQSFGF